MQSSQIKFSHGRTNRRLRPRVTNRPAQIHSHSVLVPYSIPDSSSAYKFSKVVADIIILVQTNAASRSSSSFTKSAIWCNISVLLFRSLSRSNVDKGRLSCRFVVPQQIEVIGFGL